MEEKISIIVPVYNSQSTLEKCIDSLRFQTYKNIEIILVDDGSSDCSGTMCEEMASKDNRIRVIHKCNQGVSAARNDGINVSTGKYLLFVDSDDYVSPRFVTNLYNAIHDDYQCVMAVEGMIKVGKSEGRFPLTELKQTITTEEAIRWLLCGYNIKGWLWNKIYRKEIIGEIRLLVGLHYLEDLEFNLRMLSQCTGLVRFINCYDYYYNVSLTSASHGNERRIKGIEQFHEAITYIEDGPEKKYRFIKDYLSELRSLEMMRETDPIVKRNISYIRKNMISCWKLMNKKEKEKTLICIMSYPLFRRIVRRK